MKGISRLITHRPLRRTLPRYLARLGFVVAASAASLGSYAACQYQVVNEWAGGFVAAITLSNTTSAPVEGWTLNWQYAGDNRIANGWSANYTGSNPYSASNLAWNGTLQPGQSVEIGFQGSKGSAAAEVPSLQGTLCDSAASASSSSLASSSSEPVSVSSSSSSSTPVGALPLWDLNSANSYLNFVSTKNLHTMEVHYFSGLTGHIDNQGSALVSIDLNTINSGFAIRDQRMRDFLFETATYPSASIRVDIPAGLLDNLSPGQVTQVDITAQVDLHGAVVPVTAKVSVQRLSESRVMVQNIAPVLTRAGDFNLTEGLETLRGLVNLNSISAAVPVDFALVFDAR